MKSVRTKTTKSKNAKRPRTLPRVARATKAAVPPFPTDRNGRPTALVEHAVLNAPRVGNSLSIGDLIMEALAPEVISEASLYACEPPEATILRQLGMELAIMADALESKEPDNYVDLPTVLRKIAKRASASEDLMSRLRHARFGTSATWGGVAAEATVTS
jgi:hypothetical protein